MKDTLTDANFPRTADGRVYHLGVRPGEVANRIVTVGTPSRANTIASHLDEKPKPFVLTSERGFMTITGLFKGTPVSIVSIGMGSPNMDFFVREIRESVAGDLAIIRLGSCGALVDVPVSTVVVPKACVAVSRNVDFDFVNPQSSSEPAYRISKPVSADPELTEQVLKALEAVHPPTSKAGILAGTVNASADSFYSSQGRQTSFPDHNADLIEHLVKSVPDLATLEMETFHLYHLAACWGGRTTGPKAGAAPLTTGPVSPTVEAKAAGGGGSIPSSAQDANEAGPSLSDGSVIRAAAAQMVFAARTSRDFITPQEVEDTEHWTALGVLIALANTKIPQDRMHSDKGSVWELA
ncbi:unnamed protein product [Cyclocybe aegerita]|uniref:Nucleoside phosphorylase domain-containing protein n=1 Tax=Cyclocybe aegerita TaxID=1973307 RepID=A0A8S0VYH4_CYCAE|nr:unnamed protein product [Cyclocybe aegerita]